MTEAEAESILNDAEQDPRLSVEVCRRRSNGRGQSCRIRAIFKKLYIHEFYIAADWPAIKDVWQVLGEEE